jgi:hypothetical protein
MEFEKLQKAWQEQGGGPPLTIDPSLLLKLVQRNKQTFELLVFWCDVREVGACIFVAILFTFFGTRSWWGGLIWFWYVAALLALGVGTFMVVDRIRQRRQMPVFGEPLLACVECSLAQVNHQIWLLKNVLWWYLLPPIVGIALVVSQSCFVLAVQVADPDPRWFIVRTHLLVAGFCVVLYYGIYRLNQWVVRKELQPRKEELEALLASLKAGEE